MWQVLFVTLLGCSTTHVGSALGGRRLLDIQKVKVQRRKQQFVYTSDCNITGEMWQNAT